MLRSLVRVFSRILIVVSHLEPSLGHDIWLVTALDMGNFDPPTIIIGITLLRGFISGSRFELCTSCFWSLILLYEVDIQSPTPLISSLYLQGGTRGSRPELYANPYSVQVYWHIYYRETYPRFEVQALWYPHSEFRKLATFWKHLGST